MTIFLPLEASSPFPSSPAFLSSSSEPTSHVHKVIKTILKARRIAVVCGAGISVQAGIPDFRSSDGLFQSLKKDNPSLSSGKDLFDASVFNSENTTSLFCQMIAQLSEMSQAAQPTSFHKLLRTLDDRGRLLRVYTQNIDALESKTGLTFGIPELDGKRFKPRSSKGKPDPTVEVVTHPPNSTASTSRLPTPPVETPRCIPLHGTLQAMHCQICLHSFPLEEHLLSLSSGNPPPCPECTSLEATRQLIGKRSRGVGKLRPSVVLYNEVHKDGEEVGEVVRRDLVGNSKGKGRAGADLLLVVGTSLRVPGTKRIVREFSKAVHARSSPPSTSTSQQEPSTSSSGGLATPTPSPRRTPTVDEEPPIRTVYLNLDFPVPTREWEGVFDVWVRGDAQSFAQMVHDEMEKEEKAKEAASERKKRREEKREEAAALAAAKLTEEQLVEEKAKAKTKRAGKKRKNALETDDQLKSAKRRKSDHHTLPTPPSSTASSSSSSSHSKLSKSRRKNEHRNERLIIKIPPRPQYFYTTPPSLQGSRYVPEVVIPTRSSTPRREAETPLPSPPPSPLTPLSSPALRAAVSPLTKIRRKANTRITSSRRKAKSERVPSPPRTFEPPILANSREPVTVEWLDGPELSDLEDDGMDSLETPPSESLVRTVQYGLRLSGT